MILPHKDRTIDKLKPVQVYRNVKYGGRWYSVRQGGRVVGHADELSLLDVTFHVGKRGNKKVRETGVKNVHAWITGLLSNYALARIGRRMAKVTYNPKTHKTFIANKKPIKKAKSVVIYSGGVLACR